MRSLAQRIPYLAVLLAMPACGVAAEAKPASQGRRVGIDQQMGKLESVAAVFLLDATEVGDGGPTSEEPINGTLQVSTDSKGKLPLGDDDVVRGDGAEVVLDERANEGPIVQGRRWLLPSFPFGHNSCTRLYADGRRPADKCRSPIHSWPICLA
jgi:hypothetical protein